MEATPRKRLEDLFLSDLCERACRGLIEEQHRAGLLRSQSLEPRHRVLLVGPPGNGKTSLAEALAEALAVSFFVVRYDAIIAASWGRRRAGCGGCSTTPERPPCVLFFDEFDAVGKERGDVNETGEIKRVVTSLLIQVDDLPSYTVVIAASNHSELLDRAGLAAFPAPAGAAHAHADATDAVFRCVRAQDGATPGTKRGVDRQVPGQRQLRRSGRVLSRCPQAPRLVAERGSVKAVVAEQLALWKARARQQGCA